MAILILAEHDGTALKPATLHATAAARSISSFTGGDIHVLVAGHGARGAAQLAGVAKVLLADAPHLEAGLAENIEATTMRIARNYSHIVAASTAAGKNVAPRIAAQLDVAQISDIVAVDSADTFQRPIYAGNAIATVQSLDPIMVVTVRTTAFDPVASGGNAPVETIDAAANTGVSRLGERAVTKLERPELTSADVIVSGGRGLGSAENYANVLEPLANRLDAALGASRAAVDAGLAPNDYQVGADRQDRRAAALRGGRHLGRDPASRGHERLQGDRRHQ